MRASENRLGYFLHSYTAISWGQNTVLSVSADTVVGTNDMLVGSTRVYRQIS